MTNTKFRKRALLSSVAMLLVALVALGSATFAWFTNDPTAEASGINMRSIANEGLVIITESAATNASANFANDSSWLHIDYLDSNTGRTATSGTVRTTSAASWNKVTTANGGKFYSTVAKLDSASAADPAKAVTEPNIAYNGTVYGEKIYMKVTGLGTSAIASTSASAKDVELYGLTITKAENITTKAGNLEKAFRVALVFSPDGTDAKRQVIGEWGPDDATASTKNITAIADTNSDGKYEYSEATVASASAVSKCTAVTKDAPVALGKVGNITTQEGAAYLQVVCYFDGEDTNCFTDNVDLTKVIKNIDVKLRLKGTN